MNTTFIITLVVTAALLLQGLSCSPPPPPDDLDAWGTIDMNMANQKFRLWVADELNEQIQGLMHVSTERMSPLADRTERGMIFAFDHESVHSFWMKNTIIPLDIAYVDTGGKIVKIYTMAPLDTRSSQYSSMEPIRFAIEVNGGVLGRLGIVEGDKLDIPPSVLNR